MLWHFNIKNRKYWSMKHNFLNLYTYNYICQLNVSVHKNCTIERHECISPNFFFRFLWIQIFFLNVNVTVMSSCTVFKVSTIKNVSFSDSTSNDSEYLKVFKRNQYCVMFKGQRAVLNGTFHERLYNVLLIKCKKPLFNVHHMRYIYPKI